MDGAVVAVIVPAPFITSTPPALFVSAVRRHGAGLPPAAVVGVAVLEGLEGGEEPHAEVLLGDRFADAGVARLAEAHDPPVDEPEGGVLVRVAGGGVVVHLMLVKFFAVCPRWSVWSLAHHLSIGSM